MRTVTLVEGGGGEGYPGQHYFIINSKITALYSRNCSVVLAYIYIHTHTSSCRESDDDRHNPCLLLTLDLTFAQTQISGCTSYNTSRNASASHTQVG